MKTQKILSAFSNYLRLLHTLLVLLGFSAALQILNASNVFAQGINRSTDSTEVWSYHFQFTGLQQLHSRFSASYSGLNSLEREYENHYSVTSTLYLGRRLWQGAEVYFNPEMSGGSGFSLTRGVAAFPNGEVYRVGNVDPVVVVARAFLRQHIALGGEEKESVNADQNQLAGSLPVPRLTLTAGKFGLMDVFDDNAYSHDPRTQFMNWALMGAGAWDYAADVRGYTYGIAAELHQPTWELNFAITMVPSVANGPGFDRHISKAYSMNLEFVKTYQFFNREGKFHLIGFLNRAHMGSYRQAIDDALLAGITPDVTKTRRYSSKYGFVISLEQPLSETVGLFSRFSWNEGANETWAFAEIDQSFHIGANLRGDAWSRKEDNIGIAFLIGGISKDHRDYLAAGGYGFMIGDGKLNYGMEQIWEVYYSFKMTPSFWLTLDDQIVVNPAYNRDRGPVVNTFAIRGHVEF